MWWLEFDVVHASGFPTFRHISDVNFYSKHLKFANNLIRERNTAFSAFLYKAPNIPEEKKSQSGHEV